MLKVRTGASVAVKVTLAIVDRVLERFGNLKKLGEESCVSKMGCKKFCGCVRVVGGGLLMSV